MKTFIKNILPILLLLFLMGCNSQKMNPESYQRQWMLVSFQNFNKDLLVKNRASINLTPVKDTPNQYNAFMGCNQMFFTAKLNGDGTVKFSDVGSTMMYCEKNMDLETAFAKALPMMTKFKINGHQLTLSDDKGNEMEFVASDWD